MVYKELLNLFFIKMSDIKDIKSEVEETETETIVEENLFEDLLSKVQSMSVEMRSIISIVKNLQKENNKLKKIANKKKAKKSTGEKKSGFSIPVKITNELADFLNVERESFVTRQQVTKMLTTYIKENKLYSEEDKRMIRPNEALIKILQNENGDAISYFNIQRYIKHHFIKDKPIEVV